MKNLPGNFLTVAGIIALVAIVSAFGFNKMNTTSSPSADESRIVAPFSKLEVAGGFEVRITQGAQTPIAIKGSTEDIQNIITEVKGSTLRIKPNASANKNYNMGKVVIEFSVPDLSEIQTAGSCVITSKGTFGGGKDMEFSISGSGTITMDVHADELESSIAGSGETKLSGKVKAVELNISGSGNFKCENLQAESAEISVAGSGNAYIGVTSKLKANISGSGNVYYSGSPAVEKNIAGSGNVQAK